jgi:hypothetical protein
MTFKALSGPGGAEQLCRACEYLLYSLGWMTLMIIDSIPVTAAMLSMVRGVAPCCRSELLWR